MNPVVTAQNPGFWLMNDGSADRAGNAAPGLGWGQADNCRHRGGTPSQIVGCTAGEQSRAEVPGGHAPYCGGGAVRRRGMRRGDSCL